MASRKCQKCELNRDVRFYVSERGRVCISCQRKTRQEAARRSRVGQYGITSEEYALLFERQQGLCAACKQPRKYNLHVDHDHKLERRLLALDTPEKEARRLSVRGLLCARCNSVLRKIRDDRDIALGLMWYLDYPPARKVLN